MVYRIDLQHFLSHAVDYFTRDEIMYFQYAIISAKIKNQGRATNIVKINQLYPDVETVATYAEYKDKKILEKMYFEMLDGDENDKDGSWASTTIYKVFVNPLIHHYDIMILCDSTENVYVDALCKYLDKNFSIEVIDLNELFTKGEIGPIYIDRDEIWNKAVDIRRAATKSQYKALESSSDGRLKLLGMMNTKQKIAKLNELGIKVKNNDKKELDSLLIDAWVNSDSDEGED